MVAFATARNPVMVDWNSPPHMAEPVHTTLERVTARLPRGRGSRRWLYSLILVVLLGGLAEIGALVAFQVLDGRAFTFARLAAERQAALESTPLPDSFRAGGQAHSESGTEVLHPYLGYALDVEHAQERPPDAVPTLRIEECGMPGPRRSPDTLLVGLFGGSVAFLFSQEGAKRLADAIRSMSFAEHREVRFVVAAAGGWKQPQQMMALGWLLSIGGELDLLINLDGFNEVALHAPENGLLGTFPAYPRRWAARVEPVPDAATRLVLGRLSLLGGARIAWAEAATSEFVRWSVTANLLWRARDHLFQRQIEQAAAKLRRRPSTTPSFLTQGPDYDGHDAMQTMDDLVTTWERSSRVLGELCRANGIRYFHFLQPNQCVEGSKPLSAEEREKCWAADHPFRAGVVAGYPRLRESGARLALEGESFHDLSMAFVDVTATLYTDSCCHFNRHGCELVADRIAEVLRSELPKK